MERLDYYREFWVWRLRIAVTWDRNSGKGVEILWNPYDPYHDLRASGGLEWPDEPEAKT